MMDVGVGTASSRWTCGSTLFVRAFTHSGSTGGGRAILVHTSAFSLKGVCQALINPSCNARLRASVRPETLSF